MRDAAAVTEPIDAQSSFRGDGYEGDPEVGLHSRLHVPGRHNVLNATAAVAMGVQLGVAPEQIAAGSGRASAAWDRRFQVKGVRVRGVTVVDDYGHHPTEILATHERRRASAGTRQVHVLVLFQPPSLLAHAGSACRSSAGRSAMRTRVEVAGYLRGERGSDCRVSTPECAGGGDPSRVRGDVRRAVRVRSMAKRRCERLAGRAKLGQDDGVVTLGRGQRKCRRAGMLLRGRLPADGASAQHRSRGPASTR